ncbi:hypothetical protein [Mycobacterium sp. AZCC_0083]|uniref:hypothetical protein n=1 Tax=Mycobacterium sp. AZCC_0083 TaxID=2735882 RepID=UPI00160C5CEB|nr:hypothetical protein [Mycobacterium sp. AZCC_0083]MBB5161590.1 hypothetical protein [Mycobacterium sp. AZCC_0083]
MTDDVFPLQIPEAGYLNKVGLVVFLVAELEGLIITDLVRFHPLLPPQLDFATLRGMKVAGMTTSNMGQYFLAHAPRSTDEGVAEYYRAGGQALIEIGPKRNAMLHARPGVDGNDPQQKLRLLRWRPDTDHEKSEAHMIDDEWIDDLISTIIEIRTSVVASRPRQPRLDGLQ